MVQIIQRPPSFGEEIARNLGSGVGQAISNLPEAIASRRQAKQFAEHFQKLKEEHPGDRTYQMLSDIASAPMPLEQKAQFLRAVRGMGDAFRQQQQQRLERDSLLRKYGSRIKEIDDVIKTGGYGTYEEKQQLQSLKRALQSERDRLLEFEALRPQEGFEEEEFEEEFPEQEAVRKKPKYDATNPLHKKRAEEVLKKTRGDRKKAALVLSKEFD